MVSGTKCAYLVTVCLKDDGTDDGTAERQDDGTAARDYKLDMEVGYASLAQPKAALNSGRIPGCRCAANWTTGPLTLPAPAAVCISFLVLCADCVALQIFRL